jgi:hypothetical protein
MSGVGFAHKQEPAVEAGSLRSLVSTHNDRKPLEVHLPANVGDHKRVRWYPQPAPNGIPLGGRKPLRIERLQVAAHATGFMEIDAGARQTLAKRITILPIEHADDRHSPRRPEFGGG